MAEAVSRAYGTDFSLIASRREFTTCLTEALGRKVLVTSTGIGGPSTSIAIDELAQLGVTHFIRVGTTGAIQDDIKNGDCVITTGSVRLDGASTHYAPIEYPAVADFSIVAALVLGAKEAGVRFHVGVTASSDTFYPGEERSDSFMKYKLRRFRGATREWKALHVLNYEMESSTLLTVTSALGLRGGCVTGVVNRAQHREDNRERFLAPDRVLLWRTRSAPDSGCRNNEVLSRRRIRRLKSSRGLRVLL
ncbi:MAG: uridine phosphorylase [Deltaproteobacteria bacterium]|nr:uridine phosphorylase [Deltaproteobacteria bacterium]